MNSDHNQNKTNNNSLQEENEWAHRGWYSRGYLPHYESARVYQGITFRLYDSLPAHVIAAINWDRQQKVNPEKRVELEKQLNKGYGSCYLQDKRIGSMVQNTLLHFDKQRYKLLAWVIMPNHVHTLIEVFDAYPVSGVVQAWKSYSAKAANKILRRTGTFWYRSYFDRFIRDEKHMAAAVHYIHQNPVKAGLVSSADEWIFSSSKQRV
jgi:putative transposase